MTQAAPPAAMASAASGQRMPAMLIVADDLSGAADCGIACVERGLKAVVALRANAGGVDADVLAIDADTRAMDSQGAADTTARLAKDYDLSGDCLVFKKLDSTLRGHFAAEIAALLPVRRGTSPDSVAILAPAFPALGRTTVGGYQRLLGKPLEETEPWQREGRSGRAFLPAMVATSGLRCELLPLDRVRNGSVALLATMRDLASGCDVIVCDAETDDDLAALAKASFQLGRATIWAGSAGLVGHLVDAAGLAQSHTAPVLPTVSGSLVFVVGSGSSVARRQAAALAASDGVVSIDIDPTSSSDALRTSGFAARFASALATGKTVLVWQATDQPPADSTQFRHCRDLAALIAREGGRIGALFATGGETARCLLEALDVDALRLVEEVAPGIPLSVAVGARSFPVITKAGAFGNDATIVNCRTVFSRAAGPSPATAVQYRRVGA